MTTTVFHRNRKKNCARSIHIRSIPGYPKNWETWPNDGRTAEVDGFLPPHPHGIAQRLAAALDEIEAPLGDVHDDRSRRVVRGKCHLADQAPVCRTLRLRPARGTGERSRSEPGRVRTCIGLFVAERTNGERRGYPCRGFYRRASDAAVRDAGSRRQSKQRALRGGADHRSWPLHQRKDHRCVAGGRARPRHFRFDAGLPQRHMGSCHSTGRGQMTVKARAVGRTAEPIVR
jgi:hypothetical protein